MMCTSFNNASFLKIFLRARFVMQSDLVLAGIAVFVRTAETFRSAVVAPSSVPCEWFCSTCASRTLGAGLKISRAGERRGVMAHMPLVLV